MSKELTTTTSHQNKPSTQGVQNHKQPGFGQRAWNMTKRAAPFAGSAVAGAATGFLFGRR